MQQGPRSGRHVTRPNAAMLAYDQCVLAEASAGLIAFVVIGVACVVAGVALMRDWGQLGTGSASIFAMFSYARGRQAFARDWNRRSRFRKWQGGWLTLFGLIMTTVALRSLLS